MPIGRSTRERGASAEKLACQYLKKRGYRIRETNYKVRQGEIDIVADEGGVLCFIEVRSRASTRYGHPIETIDIGKQQRLIRAARHYLVHRRCADRAVRFDVLGLIYEPEVEFTLIKNAFDATTA